MFVRAEVASSAFSAASGPIAPLALPRRLTGIRVGLFAMTAVAGVLAVALFVVLAASLATASDSAPLGRKSDVMSSVAVPPGSTVELQVDVDRHVSTAMRLPAGE